MYEFTGPNKIHYFCFVISNNLGALEIYYLVWFICIIKIVWKKEKNVNF